MPRLTHHSLGGHHWLLPFLVTWISLLHVTCSKSQGQTTHPNIVFIVADDLGWNDIGFNNPDIISPNIDSLARGGVILNQTYVQPLCSPSRSALMTGVYPFRLGLQHLVILNQQAVCVPYDRPFLPEVLKQGGYATHMIGKWHLGFCNWNCTPTYRGFDSFYGYYNAMEDYYTKTTGGGFDFRDNKTSLKEANGTYSAIQYGARIKKIIANHDTEKPLFLYLPFQSVHEPLEVPKKYYDMYPNIKDEKRRNFSGMVTALDDAVALTLSSLKAKGIYDNTLIAFTADNGGWIPYGGNNYPLRGGKLTVFEGGTRAVAFVHGPMFNRTGIRHDGLMHMVDWFPTLVEAAGLVSNVSDQDGVSQWKSLVSSGSPGSSGSSGPRDEIVYNLDDSISPVQGKAAIRIGDFKLVDGYPGLYPDWYKPAQYPEADDSFDVLYNPYDLDLSSKLVAGENNDKYLFNLKDDPTEHVNLYNSMPDVVKRLEQRLNEHRKRMVKPNFPAADPKGDPKYYQGNWSPGWCS